MMIYVLTVSSYRLHLSTFFFWVGEFDGREVGVRFTLLFDGYEGT